MNGRTIYRIYQPNVKNPKTDAQETQRQKMRLLGLLGSRIGNFLSEIFANLDGYRRGTWYSAFIGYNLKHDMNVTDASKKVISGSYPNQAINYANLQVSPATLQLPGALNASADPEGTSINVTWSDDSASGNGADSKDKFSFLAINTSQRAAVAFVDNTIRRTQTAALACPTSWNGQSCHLYLVARSEDEARYSATQYLGEITF